MGNQLSNALVDIKTNPPDEEEYQLAFYGQPNAQIENFVVASLGQMKLQIAHIHNMQELLVINAKLLPDV